MRTLYRLRFRDGSVSAWDSDYERIKKSAKFFRAEIESRVFNPIPRQALKKNKKIFKKVLTKHRIDAIIQTQKREREDRKMMNAKREALLDRIIKIYGFEHEVTLDFARLCEEWVDDIAHDRILEMLVESHEEFPQIEDDED